MASNPRRIIADGTSKFAYKERSICSIFTTELASPSEMFYLDVGALWLRLFE
jgi:hypothetical protein